MELFACKTLQVDVALNGVVDITLQREEKHNALNALMISELSEVLDTLKEDDSVRVLCLQGAGKSFCAGADLAWMQEMVTYEAKENFTDAVKLSRLLSALYYFPKPTVVTTHGAVYGGAIGLVACCDIAIGSNDSRFCLSETKLGLVPATISPYVIAAIGARAFNYCTLTASPFSASDALKMGLLHQVIENPVQLAVNKKKIIEQLLNNGPIALLEAKKLTRRVAQHVMDAQLNQELAELIASLRVGEEAQTRMLAFLQSKQ